MIDFFKPLRRIFENFATFVEDRMAEDDHVYIRRVQKPLNNPFDDFVANMPAAKATTFETMLMLRHCALSQMPGEKAIRVSIIPLKEGTYGYTDPATGQPASGTYDIGSVSRNESITQAVNLHQRAGYHVVMIIDPHKPLEDQIPGWRPGTMVFPNRFLANPVVTVQDEAPPANVQLIRPAIGRKTNGETYTPPENIIRGIVINGP